MTVKYAEQDLTKNSFICFRESVTPCKNPAYKMAKFQVRGRKMLSATSQLEPLKKDI